jgi:tRNA nucleotidyltransferase/poly(A) polymerase
MKTLAIQLPAVVKEIAKAISQAGGRAFLVGGTVRDVLFNAIHKTKLDSKDIDIEVFGLKTDQLVEILIRFGRVDGVGKSFGVLKVTIGNLDLDFSLPRREVKTGQGHTGFEVLPDHTMTVEEAVIRRDFTMNAMMMEILTGQLIDLVDGIKDIEASILRHVSEKFAEDPLRVLRGVQFAARFSMVMAEETVEMCKSLKSEFAHLPKERVWIEWEKFLGKGKHIAFGLEVLKQTGWDEFFTMFHTPNEGLNNAVAFSNAFSKTSKERVVILLTLMGGTALVEKLTNEVDILRQVNELEEMMIELAAIFDSDMDLSVSTALKLCIGKHQKHCPFNTAVSFFKSRSPKPLQLKLDTFTPEMFVPLVKGNDLIAAGWNPAKAKGEFGKELKRLFEMQLIENLSKEELLNLMNKPV